MENHHYTNTKASPSAAGEGNVLVQDSAAKLSTPGASDEKKKMIRQTLVHSLKKLFDMGLVGLTAVVFGWGRFGAAGQQKPPVAAA